MADPGESELEGALARLTLAREDPEAWRVVMRLVRNTARKMFHGRERVEDVSQEVLVRLALYGKFDQFKDAQAFRRYVGTMLRNSFSDMWKEERRSEDFLREHRERVFRDSRPAAALPERSLRHEIPSASGDKFSERLSPWERQVTKLILEGYTFKHIATSLGMAPNVLRVRLYRLRRRLKGGQRDDQDDVLFEGHS